MKQSFEEMYWVKVSPAEPVWKPGVYVIKFPGGFVYCGASFNIRLRLSDHIHYLEAGIHGNFLVQSAWEECSGEGVLISWRELVGVTVQELHAFEVKLLEHWRVKVGTARLLNLSLHPLPINRRCRARRPLVDQPATNGSRGSTQLGGDLVV